MTLAFRRDFNHTFHRAFDDCAVTESIFKLLHIFGNLVQRNLIALELSDKMPLLIVTLEKEMDDARKIFMKQQVALSFSFLVLIYPNPPPVQDCRVWKAKDGAEHASRCWATQVCQGGLFWFNFLLRWYSTLLSWHK